MEELRALEKLVQEAEGIIEKQTQVEEDQLNPTQQAQKHLDESISFNGLAQIYQRLQGEGLDEESKNDMERQREKKMGLEKEK